jgi:hypothetical protein
VRSLAETQGLFRSAISGGPADDLLALVRTPGDAAERLGIYRRHHRESFRRHLRGRFPTLEWLVGTPGMIELADELLQAQPPRAPSLAEYGEGIVDIVRNRGGLHPAWLADVARLDWHLGNLSVAVEHPPVEIAALAGLDPATLPDACVTLQPGLAYLQSEWPIDQLVHLRLTGGAPAELRFDPQETCLELRGSRGRFSINRLSHADLTFRHGLNQGRSFGDAAQLAFEVAADFDLGAGLVRIFADGLVVAIQHTKGNNHD